MHPEPYEWQWIGLDRTLFGLDPTIALAGTIAPWFAEILQWVYASFYLMPIVTRAFFRPLPDGQEDGIKEAPLLILLPICTTALACFVIFFYADGVYRLLAPVMGMGGVGDVGGVGQ